MKNFDISRYKCAVFDVDGTLLDSMPMWWKISFEFAELHGKELPEGMEVKMNSMSLRQCAEYYREKLGIGGSTEEVMQGIMELAADRYRYKVGEMPGAAEFLRYIKEKGLKAGLATASDTAAIRPGLERLGMAEYIDYGITCTDVGKSKESPDVYFACAGHFGCGTEDTVVFEDMYFAAKTASEAGFTVVGICDPCQSQEAREDLRGVCDFCISDYRELMNK